MDTIQIIALVFVGWVLLSVLLAFAYVTIAVELKKRRDE